MIEKVGQLRDAEKKKVETTFQEQNAARTDLAVAKDFARMQMITQTSEKSQTRLQKEIARLRVENDALKAHAQKVHEEHGLIYDARATKAAIPELLPYDKAVSPDSDEREEYHHKKHHDALG